MNAGDLQPGMKLTNAAHSSRPQSSVVSRVHRTLWRRRVTRFWLIWENEDSEAEHLPEDAAYLDQYSGHG